jgi:nitrogen fixation NifU-like protein
MAEDLYDDLIMEHIRNARNYRAPEPASLEVSGTNPLCGDEMTLYVDLRGGRLEDIAFQCTCCGISMASASIMTEMMRGRDRDDARARIRAFLSLVDAPASDGKSRPTREQRALLATVRKFSSRARCAALPWSTLEAALKEPADEKRAR